MYDVKLTESYFPAQGGPEPAPITIGDMLRASAARTPNQAALKELGYGGAVLRTWTYAELLADAEQRDALGCIRCGACLNVCPIFKNVGGYSYGTTYGGPIGSVITPHLRGLKDRKHLSAASSLCSQRAMDKC